MASSFGTIGRIGVLVQPELTGVQKKVRDGLGKPLAQEAPKQGVNLGDAIVNGTTRAFKWGGVAAGAALGAAITKGFGRLRAMEDATAKIEGLGYAAQDVDQIMTDVRGALDGTMFLYSEGANVAAGALAAGVEQGAELESYLRLTADAATQAGIDFGTMGQVMNKVEGDGRLMGDTVQQLAENGVYVLPALAEEFGVTGEEMRKMVSNGEVDAETFRRIMEEQYGGSSERAAETMTGAMSLAWTAVGQLGERLISEVYPYLRDFFQGFYDWVQEISPAVEDFGKRVGEAIGNIISWIKDNPGIVKGFAVALTMVATAMAAYTAYVKTVAVLTRAWATVQAILNGQLLVNPVGLWVAAIAALVTGLIWAYNNVDWFRNAVQVAWDAITTAFTWAWEGVIQPVINWIGDAWNWLAGVFVSVWENLLSPVFEAVGTVVTWLWENVLSPVFTWIGDHWQYILLGMQLYWETVLKPVWNAISAAATWLWANVLSPVFTWIGDHWEYILLGMQLYWNRVLKPVWDAIAAVATWLWQTILSPIFTWIGDKWASMSASISNVYNNSLKPVFDKLGEIVTDLKDKFKTGVDNIKEQWDKLKSIAADPVEFVIVDIFNDGLINTLNKIPGVNISDVPVPSWVGEYADGGWTGPGSRLTPAGLVHADEYVVRKSSRGRFERENPGLLDHINKYGTMAGYASGGLVRPVNGTFTSGFGASRGRYPHAGVDWAVPVGTPVRAALGGTVARTGWNVVNGRTGIGVFMTHPGNRNTYYGHLSRSQVSVGDQIAKGGILGLSGNTGRSTGPHLHFETWTGGKPVDPMKYMGGLPASADGGEGGGWFDPLAPFRALGAKIKSSIADKFPGAGYMIDAAAGIAKQGFDDLLKWAKSKIPGLGDPDDGSSGGDGDAKDQVRDVAARYGWDSGSQWDAIDKLVQRESSWNVTAKNPNSSAEGLFQKMTSLHGPVGSTASQQAEWGLNYIWNRYGNPMNALLHQRNLGYYADGGYVQPDRFMVRDRGGVIPPGLNMVLNGTGRDEYALTGAHMDTLVDSLANRGPAVNIENAYALSTEALARDIETSRRRAAALAPVL